MKSNKEIIDDLILEAQTNLRLYTSGQDDYAINRYNQLMDMVRILQNEKPKSIKR